MPVTMRRVQTLLRTTLCSKNGLFLLQVMTVVPSSHASKSSSFLIQLHADMWLFRRKKARTRSTLPRGAFRLSIRLPTTSFSLASEVLAQCTDAVIT
ncbi:hypothetical protein M404DRAFT_999208 [Pisolithus tinctorius Marx 270]|uniref:Uncharacterized protein n=1 Tax=Pisolithus tinctorius Marx 270 TaxID=870435 RepID=A0A0C3PDV0_PISTI|nr:hypothetical protein M404DRAFT_999208 [Pisolithus tinctorius Marx 270]